MPDFNFMRHAREQHVNLGRKHGLHHLVEEAVEALCNGLQRVYGAQNNKAQNVQMAVYVEIPGQGRESDWVTIKDINLDKSEDARSKFKSPASRLAEELRQSFMLSPGAHKTRLEIRLVVPKKWRKHHYL